MRTIFRTNNPTKMVRLERSVVSLRVIRNEHSRSFYLEKLDSDTIQLPSSTNIACVAIAGQTVQYFDLGTLAQPDFRVQELTEIGEGAALRFRVMFCEPDTARILASVEDVRSSDEDGPTASLISIEPCSLGGPVWRLELPGATGELLPTLLVEQRIFPFAKAVMTDETFLAYILPEVVRQIAAAIAELNIGEESDDSWAVSWERFFATLNVAARTEENHDLWIEDCVKAFCHRGQMLAVMEKILAVEGVIKK